MQRRYTEVGEQNASVTVATILTVVSAATIRPSLYFLSIGSAATPADNAFNLMIRRFTAAGTATAVVPQAHDPGDPAALASAGSDHTIEPTYTAATNMMSISVNQQNTFKWETLPQYGLKCPATAANGLGLLFAVVSGGTALCQATFFHAE